MAKHKKAKDDSAKKIDRSVDSSVSEKRREKTDTKFWFRLASITVIVPVYAAIVICMLVMPRSTISNIEKRELAKFPEFSWESYWSGEYTDGIKNYFDDTVPYRDSLKQAASRLNKFLGIKYNNVQVSGQMYVVNNSSNNDTQPTGNNTGDKNTTAATSQTTSAKQGSDKDKKDTDKDKKKDIDTDKKKDTDTEEEKPKGQEIADGVFTNGSIVVYQDGHYRAMSMYGGGSGSAYINSLNSFADDLPGVRVYSMVAPTASEFYTPKNFADYNASQENDIVNINNKLSGVTGINICPVLAKHTKENIYTRTDHHWMSLGAYYAAQTFAKEAGVPFPDISKYNKKSIEGYVGTMYTFTDNNADLLNDPEDFIYYEPSNTYKTEYYTQAYGFSHEGALLQYIGDTSSLYMTYMGGDGYVTKITTDVKNGRRLCVVKDSYGNAEIPFYTSSFEAIYVVDMRYFELNLVDFIHDENVTDLLFTMCSYSAVGTNANNLENLRTRSSTPAVVSEEPEDEEPSEPEEEVSSEPEQENDNNDYYENDDNNDYGNDNGEYEDYGDNQYYEEEY
ncbi:MAG: hypothetical protein II440_03125 [Clostridia bacterium]|nr:hypothetical protein [Clostridia bacterium]